MGIMQALFTCTLGQKKTEVLHINTVGEAMDRIGTDSRPALWVCDSHTRALVPGRIAPVVLPPGEQAKNWKGIETIVSEANRRGMARDGRFVACGGGVVCDMTAFASSIYMRGCRLTLIPTSLLAMVDASLGGKTAIDHLGMKNLLGTFYPADEVFLCFKTLKSLPETEYRNGLGEVLKHAILAGTDDLASYLEAYAGDLLERDDPRISDVTVSSLRVKQSYIERDPTEQLGIRDALNLGHTFAHALESAGNLSQWSHGEAVAWGVVRALQAGVALGITSEAFAARYERLFETYRFTTSRKTESVGRFLEALESDKKKRDSVVRFVLMSGQGTHRLVPLDRQLVVSLIS